MATAQRGVWEFVPASSAGRYSQNDPVMPLKSYLAAHPSARLALTFQAGSWAHGVTDRVPSHLEVAAMNGGAARRLPDALTPSVFVPILPTGRVHGVDALAVESILVHMASEPSSVRSWVSTSEWLPELAGEATWARLTIELGQNLLLRQLDADGPLDRLAFKGGTSLRKPYAGTAGRISIDLDFALTNLGDDPDDVLTDLIAAVNGLRIGPFTFLVTERRGKWTIGYDHTLAVRPAVLRSKLDISPPHWLTPIRRGWLPLLVRTHYGEPPLPEVQVVQLAENTAEKVA
ncbi:MAG: nucleotidyl transferase AbiEii/AbiGii toxin family protein [Bifidobacteriaceae bacterium]|nr:nucleotidyl transferase AbiEii/AbiGii toxin family protein [Bifidobacteriaceae bacterium]